MASNDDSEIGISAVAYALPPTFIDVRDLEARGLLESSADAMEEFGFRGVHVSDRPADELALQALQQLIEHDGVDRESIDLLLYAGAIPDSHRVAAGGRLDEFAYPAARLQYEAGLSRAVTIGVSQTGCTGLVTAAALAADHLRAHSEANRVICVSADVLPPGARREIIYNLVSDGACALLVERHAARNRILALRRIAKGYYWNPGGCRNELVAAYFPTARTLVSETLRDLGLTADDVALLVPHNVSLRSWQILLPLLGLPLYRLFTDNIAAKGHVIAADNFINLKDAWDSGRIRSGDRLLLFNFGFGANWSCLALE
ncbi:MAG TPA: 3-oxoacyl-[acyl-carrier-protein] synthase III C-terminal domain-containing protein, partial [Vicinamibacterales bacterium]